MNDLKLERPLIFFDLETTGVSVANDRIVEVSVVKVFPDGKRQVTTRRVNPRWREKLRKSPVFFPPAIVSSYMWLAMKLPTALTS